MTREQVYVLLNDIVRDVLGDEDVAVDDMTRQGARAGWDSLAQVAILVAAEVRFGIRISGSEAGRIARMGDLADLVLDKTELVGAD